MLTRSWAGEKKYFFRFISKVVKVKLSSFFVLDALVRLNDLIALMKSINHDNKSVHMRLHSIGISLNLYTQKRSQSSAICFHIHSSFFCVFFFSFMWPWFLSFSSSSFILHQKTISQTFIHTFTLEIPIRNDDEEEKNPTKHIITIFNNSPIHIGTT